MKEKQRIQSRSDIIRSSFCQPQHVITDPMLIINTISNTISSEDPVVITDTITAQDTGSSSSLQNNSLVLPSSSDISPSVVSLPVQHLPVPVQHLSESSSSLPVIATTSSNISSFKRNSRPIKLNTSSTRRSTRPTKSARQSVKYIDECYLSSVIDPSLSLQKQQLANLVTLTTNLDSGDVEYADP